MVTVALEAPEEGDNTGAEDIWGWSKEDGLSWSKAKHRLQGRVGGDDATRKHHRDV